MLLFIPKGVEDDFLSKIALKAFGLKDDNAPRILWHTPFSQLRQDILGVKRT